MRSVTLLLLASGVVSSLQVAFTRRRAATAIIAAGSTRASFRDDAALAVAAISARRFSIEPRITPLPPLGALSRYEDQLSTPKGSKALFLQVRFEFPSQWALLERDAGGIQFVDGATGLRTYILQAELPEGDTLATVPKAWFGTSIFDQQGAIARGGAIVEDFKVSSSKLVDAPPEAVGPSRRRLSLKYTVVTPANQRVVERRAVVDAYEFQGIAYMLVASATGSKWESSEKERCERTADSFIISL
ncbi:hypothetical protein AB1Y20_019110 [Prymnesium parvum]|uniref:PsbP C-terminal domain-containing protein n=1 Tax=Prymnesium parvum TaxID=97485 RepID=A0AB34JTD6_PRYPA